MKTIDSPLTAQDVVITEVHRHKEAMISEHNNDVDALLQHLRERQKGNARLISGVRGESREGDPDSERLRG